jgi:hypothetical protein
MVTRKRSPAHHTAYEKNENENLGEKRWERKKGKIKEKESKKDKGEREKKRRRKEKYQTEPQQGTIRNATPILH